MYVELTVGISWTSLYGLKLYDLISLCVAYAELNVGISELYGQILVEIDLKLILGVYGWCDMNLGYESSFEYLDKLCWVFGQVVLSYLTIGWQRGGSDYSFEGSVIYVKSIQ